MSAVWTIARKDLRQRFRDRSAIVLGFVAPVVIAALDELRVPGHVDRFHFELVVVDHDHGPVAAALVRGLAAPQVRAVMTVRIVVGAIRRPRRRCTRAGRRRARHPEPASRTRPKRARRCRCRC